MCSCYMLFFFFSSRRRHTRLQGDWSSDVCSSDLEMKVPLIELQDESIAYLEKAGEEAGHKFEITRKDATGATIYDKTRLNGAGSYVFGRMVAADLGKAVPELKKYLRPETAKLPPEGGKA